MTNKNKQPGFTILTPSLTSGVFLFKKKLYICGMIKLSLLEQFRLWVGGLGWRLFIWGMNTSEEEYWDSIYEQEKKHREKELKDEKN